jgi:hypothetical protein
MEDSEQCIHIPICKVLGQCACIDERMDGGGGEGGMRWDGCAYAYALKISESSRKQEPQC